MQPRDFVKQFPYGNILILYAHWSHDLLKNVSVLCCHHELDIVCLDTSKHASGVCLTVRMNSMSGWTSTMQGFQDVEVSQYLMLCTVCLVLENCETVGAVD